MSRTMRNCLIPACIVVMTSVLALLFAELVIRVVVNPSDFLHATLVEDPVLGVRIKGLTSGHDALGFRNAEVPMHADIVAIGDSMTYGVSAPREGSWPYQLGKMLGEQVYNMGLGGFGPLQYLHLTQNNAVALKPRLLLIGFYFGNDLMDAYYLARNQQHWHSWRISAEDPSVETEFDRVGRAQPKKRLQGLRNWLSRNSVFYSVLRATVFHRWSVAEQDAMVRNAVPDMRMLWKDPANPAVRTIFTAQSRLAATDLDLREVREGMTISQNAFSAIKEAADQQGIEVLIALIPTKERAYCDYLQQSGELLPPAFSRLCRSEANAQAELIRFLDEKALAYIDVVPAMRVQIEQHSQLYPTDSDSHPQARGYEVIAQEVAAAIRQRFPRN